MSHKCRKCGVELIIGETWRKSEANDKRLVCRDCRNRRARQLYGESAPTQRAKVLFHQTELGVVIQTHLQYNLNTGHCGISTYFTKSRESGRSKTNRSCSSFLGVHVAERVLSRVFKNVERMQNGNPGFDFMCSRGKKIDVKSSTLHAHNNVSRWSFTIARNKIADFFLCIAFDNREDLNPLHIWLLPGNVVKDISNLSIYFHTLNDWSDYELSIKRTVDCCEAMR